MWEADAYGISAQEHVQVPREMRASVSGKLAFENLM
jgi:hypothetical protein